MASPNSLRLSTSPTDRALDELIRLSSGNARSSAIKGNLLPKIARINSDLQGETPPLRRRLSQESLKKLECSPSKIKGFVKINGPLSPATVTLFENLRANIERILGQTLREESSNSNTRAWGRAPSSPSKDVPQRRETSLKNLATEQLNDVMNFFFNKVQPLRDGLISMAPKKVGLEDLKAADSMRSELTEYLSQLKGTNTYLRQRKCSQEVLGLLKELLELIPSWINDLTPSNPSGNLNPYFHLNQHVFGKFRDDIPALDVMKEIWEVDFSNVPQLFGSFPSLPSSDDKSLLKSLLSLEVSTFQMLHIQRKIDSKSTQTDDFSTPTDILSLLQLAEKISTEFQSQKKRNLYSSTKSSKFARGYEAARSKRIALQRTIVEGAMRRVSALGINTVSDMKKNRLYNPTLLQAFLGGVLKKSARRKLNFG